MSLTTIHKFPLKEVERQKVRLRSGYSILSVGPDTVGTLCLWVAVDGTVARAGQLPTVEVEIIIVGAGHPLPHVGDFIGTAKVDAFIWHVFTGPGNSANRPAGGFHYLTRGNGHG